MMEKVSVVIPVYGRWDLVKRNIDALLKYDIDFIEEIITVDDCSPEPNPYEFNSSIVTQVQNENNLGYAGTVNNGLKRAKSEIIVVLDSDAYPIGQFIELLIKMYSENPTIGCIGFGTVDDDGNDTGNYQYEPSIAGLIAGQLLEAKFGFLRFWRNKNILPYSCAVSFRKACIEEMDYLDAVSFPVLDADHDISMRIHRSKWKLIFTREIIICHKGGNSYQINHKRVLLFYQSRWKLLKKHNLITLAWLAKLLIELRLWVELFLFNVFNLLNKHDDKFSDKIRGRKLLLEQVKQYQ